MERFGKRTAFLADDFESVVSGRTSEPWRGPSAGSMGASAVPQTEWLRTTASQATQAGAHAEAAASAIAATEAEYGEMWAQDVAAMYGLTEHEFNEQKQRLLGGR